MAKEAQMSGPSLLVGPSGWQDVSPNNLNGSAGRFHSVRRLEQISRLFDLVEIDSTFLQAPRQEISKLWVRSVAGNPRFRFTARLYKEFTQGRSLDPARIASFISGLSPLAHHDRLGCVLMEFPWAFRFTRENRQHLINLRRAFSQFPLVAEFRHDSWLLDEAVGTLLDFHIGFANLDQPEWSRAMRPTSLATTATGFVRFHGNRLPEPSPSPDTIAEPPTGASVLYSEAALGSWLPRIQRIASQTSRVFVVFRNGTNGQAAVNALQMKRLLESADSRKPVQPSRPSHYAASLIA